MNTACLPLGTIIDISKSQSIFDTAFFKTEWNAGYISYNPEGQNALGSQYILTDVEEEEVTDEVTDEITDEITNEITDNVTDENSTSNNDKLTTTGNRTGDIIILVGYIVLILSAITYIIVKKYRKMNH